MSDTNKPAETDAERDRREEEERKRREEEDRRRQDQPGVSAPPQPAQQPAPTEPLYDPPQRPVATEPRPGQLPTGAYDRSRPSQEPAAPSQGEASGPRVGPGWDYDRPAKSQERAARSGAPRHAETPGMAPPGQGGQVVLTSDAMDAARGGIGGEIAENVEARNQAIVDGHVVDGTTAAAAVGAMGMTPEDVVRIYGEMPEPPDTLSGGTAGARTDSGR